MLLTSLRKRSYIRAIEPLRSCVQLPLCCPAVHRALSCSFSISVRRPAFSGAGLTLMISISDTVFFFSFLFPAFASPPVQPFLIARFYVCLSVCHLCLASVGLGLPLYLLLLQPHRLCKLTEQKGSLLFATGAPRCASPGSRHPGGWGDGLGPVVGSKVTWHDLIPHSSSDDSRCHRVPPLHTGWSFFTT